VWEVSEVELREGTVGDGWLNRLIALTETTLLMGAGRLVPRGLFRRTLFSRVWGISHSPQLQPINFHTCEKKENLDAATWRRLHWGGSCSCMFCFRVLCQPGIKILRTMYAPASLIIYQAIHFEMELGLPPDDPPCGANKWTRTIVFQGT
jgi:hypothetical protein